MNQEQKLTEYMQGWKSGTAGRETNEEQRRHPDFMRGYEHGKRDYASAWRGAFRYYGFQPPKKHI